MVLILFVPLLSSTAQKNLRGNAHFGHFSLLLSRFPFLLSCTIPSSQSWGTTMLVINFLISFISLSPPPLPPLLSLGSLSLPSSLSFSHIICVSQSHQYSPSLPGSRLSSAPPSYFPIPIHHYITAAWFLLYLSVLSFDLHEITALPESIWPQNMKALLFKSRLWKGIDMCGIDFFVESASLLQCPQAGVRYIRILLIWDFWFWFFSHSFIDLLLINPQKETFDLQFE